MNGLWVWCSTSLLLNSDRSLKSLAKTKHLAYLPHSIFHKYLSYCFCFCFFFLYDFFLTRFAFHLRLWWLEGRGITCHQQIAQRPTEKHYPIRVLCQPAGLSDKVSCAPVIVFLVVVTPMQIHGSFTLSIAIMFKVHLTPENFFGRDETLQHSHEEFDNIISMWYF